jgi:hypothetical protein
MYVVNRPNLRGGKVTLPEKTVPSSAPGKCLGAADQQVGRDADVWWTLAQPVNYHTNSDSPQHRASPREPSDSCQPLNRRPS